MTTTTSNPVRSRRAQDDTPATARPAPRGWAVAGIVAGLAGVGTFITSGMVDAVYREDLFGDPEGVAAAVADKTAVLVVFHVVTVLGAIAMVVFAAGLHRRLAARATDSLAPVVAAAGLAATSVVSVLGSGLDTEFIFASQVGDGQGVDPHAVTLYNHWIGTIPWCWVLVGLTGVAVWQAGRSGAVPRWIGRTGLVLGGLTLLLGTSPLQYMAGMTGPLWLLVTATGFVLGDRAFRAGRA